jgi:hypothetical protein
MEEGKAWAWIRMIASRSLNSEWFVAMVMEAMIALTLSLGHCYTILYTDRSRITLYRFVRFPGAGLPRISLSFQRPFKIFLLLCFRDRYKIGFQNITATW